MIRRGELVRSSRARRLVAAWLDVLVGVSVAFACAGTLRGWLERGASSWQSGLVAGLGAAAVATVASLVAWGWLLRRGRRAAARSVLVIAVAAWAPAWASADWVPATAVVPVIAVGAAVGPGVVLLAGQMSDAGPRWPETVGVVGPAALAAVVTIAAYSPFHDSACRHGCAVVGPGPLVGVWDVDAVVRVVGALAAASAVGASVVAMTRPARPPTGVLAGCVAAAILGVLVYGARAGWWGLLGGPEVIGWSTAPAAAAATGVLLTAARTRRVRLVLEGMVSHLAEATGQAEGQEFHFPLPDGRWVDVDGRVVPDEADGSVLVRDSADGRPLARLVSPPWSGLAAIRPETRWDAGQWLALENARAAVVVRAHQREVLESQRRIVAVSDAERRRIERDLHDGIQQRLVSAKLHLALVRNRLASTDDERPLARAEEQLATALVRLREVSQGLAPRVLSTGGLEPALHDLAGRTALPVTTEVEDVDGLPLEAATAAYVVVAGLIARAASLGCESVRVRVHHHAGSGSAVVSVRTSPYPIHLDHPDLVVLTDRVGAMGGRMEPDAEDPCCVTVVIPCVW